jgi:signal peptidase II
MKISKLVRYAALLLVIGLNIGCDQVSKSIVREQVDFHQRIEVVEDHVVLTRVENTGAFLSLGDDLGGHQRNLFLLLLPGLVLLTLAGWLFRQSGLDRFTAFGLCCVVGGGLANLYDRAAYGSVTDFLYLHYGIFETGIFNLADVSITGGVVFLLVRQMFRGAKN